MFQDWPEQKAEVTSVMMEGLRRATQANSPIANLTTRITISEGDSILFIAPDGSTSELSLTSHEASVEVSREKVLSNPLAYVEAMRDLAKNMGDEIDKSLIELLRDAAPATGGLIRGKTDDEINDEILKKLEAMELSFDDDGDSGLAFVVHPNTAQRLAELGERPGVQERFDAIIEKKRHEWIRRESSRALAD